MRIISGIMNPNKEIANDVLKLYCSIKDPSLEDLFIKIASGDSFQSWIFRSKRVKGKLQNPNIYDAFIILATLRNTFSFGQKIDRQVIVTTIHDHIVTVPVILAFNEMIDDTPVKDILQQYRDLIASISLYFSSPNASINKGEVFGDVITIRDLFLKETLDEEEKPKRESVKQQRKNMFQYLLVKFTEDISSAARSSGLNDLANAVEAGILAKPVPAGLSSFFNYGKVDSSQIDTAKRMADYVIKNYEPKFGDQNFSSIEIVLMGKAGQLTTEDINQLKINFEKENNPTKFVEDPNARYPGIDTSSKITFDKKLNPDYLLMLSSLFVILQGKIGLPSFIGI